MAEQRLDIIVSVKGGATAALNTVGTALRGLGTFALSAASQVLGLVRSLFSLQGMILGMGVGALARSFVKAASDSERLQTRLATLTGSAATAAKILKDLNSIAGKTAVTMDQLEGVVTQLATVMSADDIKQFTPVLLDIAEATGMGLDEATQGIIKAYAGGIGAAQSFVKRGVDVMLGFEKGVTYSAQETRDKIIAAWTSPESRIRGAAENAARTWDGAMARLSTAWEKFRQDVMSAGLFDFIKEAVNLLLEQWGKLTISTENYGSVTKSISDTVIAGIRQIALGVGAVVDGWVGLKLTVETVYLAFATLFQGIAWGVRGAEMAFLVFKQAVISVEGAATALARVFGEVFQWILDQLVVVVGQVSSAFSEMNELTKGRLGLDDVTQGLNQFAAALYGTGTAVARFTSETAAGVAEQSKQIDVSIVKLATQKSAAEEFWAAERDATKARILALAEEVGAREDVALAFEEIDRRMAEAAAERAAAGAAATAATVAQVKSTWELLGETYQQTSQKVTNLDVAIKGLGDVAGGMADTLGQAYELSGKKQKEFLIAQKAFLIAETIMSTYAAAQKAFSAYVGIPGGEVIGAVSAATTIAQGMMRVAMIATQNFAAGGLIGGHSPTATADNIPIRATAGEFIESVPAVRYYGAGVMDAINRRRVPRGILQQFAVPNSPPSVGHRFASGGMVRGGTDQAGGARMRAVQNINNFVDPELFASYVGSRSGEDDVVNVVSRRAFEIRQILRG